MRRMPALEPPCEMVQVMRIVAPEDHGRERTHAAAMPGVPRSEASATARHISGRAPGGVEYMWERHSEATTATVVFARGEAGAIFGDASGDAAAMAWLTEAPGGVIRAVRIGVVATEDEGLVLAEAVGFSAMDLVSCRIGRVRIWSDFLLHGDGFGRLVVSADGTPPTDLGRIVQRIQELGNYRNMALLGLPVAQEKARSVAQAEAALVAIAARMAEGADDRPLLDELTALASRVTALTAETAFRMSATAAYAAIANDRLSALSCTAIEGHPTLEEFTERRLRPAVRTCGSFTDRLEQLSARIERATSLLRTRVEMSVEEQNVALLKSMNANSVRQMRLQKLVEGVSVMAISYYAVGLLVYLLRGIAPPLGLSFELLVALLVLPVFAGVWVYMRRKVRSIDAEPAD